MSAIGAVDIGGTKIAAGVVDAQGRLLSRGECPTRAESGYEDALNRIVALLRAAADAADVGIEGIGIGCTGPVYPATGKIGNVDFLPGWQGANIAGDLSNIFGVPVAMENDADAVALGEAFHGAGRGRRHVIFVTVGTGIGGGIILNGRLYRGVGDSHPEIGHHVIDPSGPQCFCGARGCWEVLARGPAIAEWFRANAPAGHPDLDGITAERVCELARVGDEVAARAVAREAGWLGIGIANLITIFSPEMVILGGSVMNSAPLFLAEIRATIRRNCGLVPFEQTALCLASLGADAPLIGAAQVWHHRFASGESTCLGSQS